MPDSPNGPNYMNDTSTRQALFFNFTNKEFIGYWDGKAKRFAPGAKQYMEEWRARHYAKHLTNKVLLEQGKENSTSPKFPEQVPDFINLFNKACIVEKDQDEEQDASDLIDKQHEASMNVPAPKTKKVPTAVDNKEPQIINSPDSDDDEEFAGLKDEE